MASTWRVLLTSGLYIVALILVVIVGAVFVFYYTGFGDTETWVNPMSTAAGEPGIPTWECPPGQRVLFKNATFSVTDSSGATRAYNVTRAMNMMRPDSAGTVSLGAPVSAFSFPNPAFVPVPAVVLSVANLGADPVSAVTAAGLTGSPVWAADATATQTVLDSGGTTYGAPFSPASPAGNILQYGAEDATAALSVRTKYVPA